MIRQPRIATLQEVETHYSFRDVLDAHEVMDWQDRIERSEQSKIEREREEAKLKRRK